VVTVQPTGTVARNGTFRIIHGLAVTGMLRMIRRRCRNADASARHLLISYLEEMIAALAEDEALCPSGFGTFVVR
jgi:hypothetical protein